MAHEQLTSFDLKACVTHAAVLHNRETLTTICPKVPSRWLFHDQFTPRLLTCTAEDEVAGGLSGLIGTQPAPMRAPLASRIALTSLTPSCPLRSS